MKLRPLAAACGFALAAALAPAHAAEVTVLASNAVKSVMEEIVPRYEKASGNKVKMTTGTSNELLAVIAKGEPFDAVFLSTSGIEEQVKAGKVKAGTQAGVARSGIGVAIKRGAPKPDISTDEALKRALLAAKSIGYVDGTPTAAYLKTLFPKLGIADQIKPKIKLVESKVGAGNAAGKGDVEIGLTQISEILAHPDAELVGPLPADIQKYTDFSAGVGAGAKEPAAGAALIKFIGTPEGA